MIDYSIAQLDNITNLINRYEQNSHVPVFEAESLLNSYLNRIVEAADISAVNESGNAIAHFYILLHKDVREIHYNAVTGQKTESIQIKGMSPSKFMEDVKRMIADKGSTYIVDIRVMESYCPDNITKRVFDFARQEYKKRQANMPPVEGVKARQEEAYRMLKGE